VANDVLPVEAGLLSPNCPLDGCEIRDLFTCLSTAAFLSHSFGLPGSNPPSFWRPFSVNLPALLLLQLIPILPLDLHFSAGPRSVTINLFHFVTTAPVRPYSLFSTLRLSQTSLPLVTPSYRKCLHLLISSIVTPRMTKNSPFFFLKSTAFYCFMTPVPLPPVGAAFPFGNTSFPISSEDVNFFPPQSMPLVPLDSFKFSSSASFSQQPRP